LVSCLVSAKFKKHVKNLLEEPFSLDLKFKAFYKIEIKIGLDVGHFSSSLSSRKTVFCLEIGRIRNEAS